MYVIKWWAPSGRSFIHVGTHKGIRELLTKELSGCRWQSVGRKRFKMEDAAAA